MSGLRAAIGCFFFLFFFAVTAAGAPESEPAVVWDALEPGLERARIPLSITASTPDASPEQEPPAPMVFSATATVLRISPAHFSFSLYMASESGTKTLAEIGARENFIAAINAGMYLPDRSTGTGYLRSATHTNNGRVGSRFGAFFVADPRETGLPPALLLDRHAHDWQSALPRYALVMQNYRMTTPEGRIIWKQSERAHSVAALAQDSADNVLFLFCPDPVPASDFIAALLRLPLGMGSVMYLEGGIDAALLVREKDAVSVQSGRHASGLWSGGANLTLPNVLGVRRRAE